MSLTMIHRLVISSCRNKVAIDASWKIIPNLSVLQRKTTVQTDTCTNHKRFFHNPIICPQKNQLKDTVIENISTLIIKNRPSRRNRTIINNDKIPKPNTWNVKALATAEEYNLEALAYGLLNQQLYIPSEISTSTNLRNLA
nr:PREDICTED: uncharacterized protein LOC105675948 [Linepithema humile]